MKRFIVLLTVWAMGLLGVLTAVVLPAGSAAAATTAGSVSGLVTTEDGKPLEGVFVNVNSPVTGGFGETTTDKLGKFTVTSLPAAEDYQVYFYPYGSTVITGGAHDATGYIDEYYDNYDFQSVEMPTPVRVSPGENTTLRPAALAAIGVTPAAPTNVTATRGNGQASVSWTRSITNEGSAVTGYTVTTKPDTGTKISKGPLANSATVPELTNGEAYTFTVTATNAAGTTATVSAPVTPAAAPAAPSGVKATVRNAEALVSWTAPTDNGGSAVTKYTVTSAPGGKTSTTTGALSATVAGLTNGTAYTFTVTATNVAGTSAASSTSAAVTPPPITQRYITHVYFDLFNRIPDAHGLATWTASLNRGTPRVAVANSITSSAEYRSTLITGSYKKYLDRTPDAGGLKSWLGGMGRGMTLSKMESGFTASPEYFAKAGSTNAGWVAKLYKDVLGRSASSSEVAGWTTQLARGMHRDKVAMGFLLSTEHLRTVVNGHYQHLLGRGIDSSGQRTWVGILQRGGRDEAIIGAIIASKEYYNRV